jgi:hypothetical protein
VRRDVALTARDGPEVSIVQLKEWMGHADIDTTMKYLHYAPCESDVELVARAFAPPDHYPDRVGNGACRTKLVGL